jgi:hypothetical protein
MINMITLVLVIIGTMSVLLTESCQDISNDAVCMAEAKEEDLVKKWG